MKSKIWLIAVAVGVIAVFAFIGFALTRPDTPLGQAQDQNKQPKSSDPNVVSESGLHYHHQLSIYINS